MKAIKEMDAKGIMQWEFLAGTCVRCNRIAGAHVFETIGEKVDFVQAELNRRKVWPPPPKVPERIRSVPIVGRGLLESSDYSAVLPTRTHIGPRASELGWNLQTAPMIRSCEKCGRHFASYSKDTKHSCNKE